MKLYDILEIIDYLEIYNKKNVDINTVSIDSRVSKDLFIGIKGENDDGSLYLGDALNNNFKVCIVDKITDKELINKYSDQVIIVVSSTKKCLLDIAHYKRGLYDIPVVALTGSAGKTSTKDLIYSVLNQKYKTLKTIDNMNNHIGVPLTILNLNDHECLVVEMGMNHYNEITYLSKCASPTISLITNIGTCHVELLGTRKDILNAKLEILDGMKKKLLVVNNDNDLLHEYALNNDAITYGILNNSDYTCKVIELNENNTIIEYKNTLITIPKSGMHNVYNSLAAITIGELLNVDIDLIKKGIEETIFTSGRSEIIECNGYKIISDCYNSNLEACKYAIEALGIHKNRKIAVLGTIGELADYADRGHGTLGVACYDNNIDIIVTVGRNTENINNYAINLGFNKDNSYHFDNKDDAIKLLKSILKKDDVVLIKASHFNNFQYIVDSLTNN